MSRLKGKAFTLIELLVVIAIISLLSSVVLASLSAAREGARDAARLSDTKNVMTAIELYKNDNSTYPPHGGNNYGCGVSTCLAVLTNELTPAYISQIPQDPKYGNTTSGYRYCSSMGSYSILARLEGKNNGGWCSVRTTAPFTGSGCWYTNGVPTYPYCN